MYIPVDLKPNQKPVDESTLSYIFNVFDELLEVKYCLFFKACLNLYYINVFKIVIKADA